MSMTINNIFKSVSYHLIKNYRAKYIKIDSDWLSGIDTNPEKGYSIMIDSLSGNKPCMISRFGNNELDAILCYKKGHPLSFLRTTIPFWVSDATKKRMSENAGFFPAKNKSLAKFADLCIEVSKEIDVLGAWIGYENNISEIKQSKIVPLWQLEPFWSAEPWTAVLKGKRVLVVHPFEDSIKQQYLKRELLFEKKNTLPEFASLHTIKAIQTVGGINNGFNSWFDALKYMEEQIDNIDYDIALIGCGAYGMPLAAHCKRMGKKAVHLGGALQLLFGIYGNRWLNEDQPHKQLINEHWVRPLDKEKPKTAENIENACYW